MTRFVVSVVLASLLLASCAQKPSRPRVGTDPLVRQPRDNTPVDDEAPLGRLPDDVVPLDYSLNLILDPRKETFSGFASIRIRLTRPRSHFWIHGAGLRVRQAQVTLANGSTRRVDYQQLTPDGVVRLALPAELEPQSIRLNIGYDAEFDRGLRGLYRVDEAGRSYAFGQFEPIDARRAFPCFDEPRFKTPYRMTLTVPSEMDAISNTSVELERVSSDGKLRTLAFRSTQKLPTYLVALAVGEFDYVERIIPKNAIRSRSVPVRGVAVKGKGQLLNHAVETTVPILEQLEAYLGIPYPYEKIDIVAVPELRARAIENVGVITFREVFLLFDKENAPQWQLVAYANLMAHELAHQWFGNFVTMSWWNDLWLNQAFATWMGKLAVDRWNAEHRAELQLLEDSFLAMDNDSLSSARSIRQPIESSHDIADAFDSMTYRKGGAVLSMLERYLGPEDFREGVAYYLDRFRHGSATAADFMESLTESSESDITGAFQSFLNQPGVPLIEARLMCEGGTGRLDLRQSRYRPLGSKAEVESLWKIPLCIRIPGGESRCFLMKDRELSVSFESRCPEWVMPNADGAGYYRLSLDDASLTRLVEEATDGALSVPERIALLDSLQSSFVAGTLGARTYFDALREFGRDPEGRVVAKVVEALKDAEDLFVQEPRGLHSAAKRLYAKRFQALGFERSAQDDSEVLLLREILAELMVFVVGDASAREAAIELGQQLVQADGGIRSRASTIDVEATILGVLVQEGGLPLIEKLVARLGVSTVPSERRSILRALGRVRDDDAAARVRDLVLDQRLRDSERLPLLLALSESREGAAGTWLWFREHFDRLLTLIGSEEVGSTPLVARALCDERSLASIDEFFGERIDTLNRGPRNLQATLEQVELCIARTKALTADTEAYFNRIGSSRRSR